MIPRCRTLFIVATVVFAGCATTAPPRPDWVAGNPEAYPGARYLVGRGQADQPAVARDRARGDLAKVFRVRVSEEVRDLAESKTDRKGDEAETRFRSAVSRNIVARSEEVLEGVEIAELWQDPELHTYHALAVLDRLKASVRLRQAVDGLDAATRALVARARASGDLLERIGAARKAVAAQTERRGVERYLRVVAPSGSVPVSPYPLGRLASDLEALSGRLAVEPRVDRDDLGGLDRVLAGAVVEAGFSIASAGAVEGYVLHAALEVTEFDDAQGWHWVRGTLETVLAGRDGTPQRRRSWQIKESARQAEQARRRTLDQVDRLLRAGLVSALIDAQDTP